MSMVGLSLLGGTLSIRTCWIVIFEGLGWESVPAAYMGVVMEWLILYGVEMAVAHFGGVDVVMVGEEKKGRKRRECPM